MMVAGEFYRHSGKFSLGGVLAGLLAGAVTGLVLSWPYAYGILYIPLAGFVTVVLIFAFAALTGLGAGLALRSQKVRSGPVALVVGLLSGVMALYASWAVWLHAVFIRAIPDFPSSFWMMTHPGGMLVAGAKANEVGVWTLRGSHPTGWFLGVLWMIEGISIVAIASWAAAAFINQDPFCEQCERWADGKTIGRMRQLEPDAFQRAFVTRDFTQLEQHGPQPKGESHLRLELHECPGCKAFHTLTVEQVDIKQVKGSKPEEKTKTVVTQLVIGTDEAARVKSAGEKWAAAATAAAAAGAAAG